MKTNNQAKPKASEVHYWLYSTGNFANNIIFMMVGTYITYFFYQYSWNFTCYGRTGIYGSKTCGCIYRSINGNYR